MSSTTLPSQTSVPWTETSAAPSVSATNPIAAHSRVAPTPARTEPATTHEEAGEPQSRGAAVDRSSRAIGRILSP